jgi:FtsP/CotA-like multicopper oxidase with cupredoxin domain
MTPLTRLPAWPLSRRRLLAGAGMAVTCLSRPGLAQTPETGPDGFRVLRARPGSATPRATGQPTPIWTYDGLVPGRTLRVTRGEESRVRLVNELSEPTTVHWHGVRLPNAMDGVAHLTQSPVAPGASFDYRFRPPDAGTFCYRANVLPASDADRGLYGALIVDEPQRIEVDHDVLLVLDDWRLAPALELPVRVNARLRLRVLNASRSQALALRIDRHAAWVMAIDGQPAEPFLARDSRVSLGPGNRVDFFVDAALAAGDSAPVVVEGAPTPIPIARLVYERAQPLRPAPLPEPKPLPPNPLPQRLDLKSALRHDLALASLAQISAPLHERPPAFSVQRRRVVVLALVNRTETACAVHVHGHHGRLLDRLDDGWKPFWLDTVVVAPRQTERIAFLADNPGKWAIDATMLGAPGGVAGWFNVT